MRFIYFIKKNLRIILIVLFSILVLLALGITLYKFLSRKNIDKDKLYLDECMEKINELFPYEIKENLTFISEVEGFSNITISFESKNTNIITNDGVITRSYNNDTIVSVNITLKSPKKEYTYEKKFKILKYTNAETEKFICKMFSEYIPDELENGYQLPTYLEEYKLTISYEKYAKKNNNNITEIEIESDGTIILKNYGSKEKCYIVANFTINGQQFSNNYIVYTLE